MAMQAFKNVRTEMRENASVLTSPDGRSNPDGIARLTRQPDEAEDDGPIEPWMEFAFHGLTRAHETGEPYALVPCHMNGEPAVVIALARPEGRRLHIMPLFLACQPWMNFTGRPEDGGEEGGGPARDDPGDGPSPR
jgi:hypothetical protein